MRILSNRLNALVILLLTLIPAASLAASIDRFIGTYIGDVELIFKGKKETRDLSTTIAPTGKGFSVTWTSVILRSDGRKTTKTYTIEFLPSDRPDIFGSAMKTNIFGKQTPLNPLQGEPFVWSRIENDTLSVFSLFINEAGDYELQEYHRTLADGGLNLYFRRVNQGATQREIRAFLARQD